MTDLPTVITSAGLQPQTPSELQQALLALVAATNPGYTANLPASLIEDISSTDVGALTVIDSARVDLIASLNPRTANAWLLAQLGAIYGVEIGGDTNTSVYVIFSGPPGFVLAEGFTVSDGTYQYTVQDGGIIGSGGTSPGLYCLATVAGSWVVPTGTVTQVITPPPIGISITCTNQVAGVPGSGAESETSYRAAVLQAGQAIGVGVPTLIKTALRNVSGVQTRLISVRQQTGGGWEVIVGGGDPYQVAYAIYSSMLDVSTLVGSTINVVGITNASNGVVTTDLNHGLTTGQTGVKINGVVGMSGVNGVNLTIVVLSLTTFSIGINTTLSGAWTSGGVVTPNTRNVAPSIVDYPDTYVVPFVNPPQQTVTMTVTWNTTSGNVISDAAMSQLGGPALMGYVNSLPAGVPMNLFELQTTFQQAVASILDPQLLTRMLFAVTISGNAVSPTAGTGIIAGDIESYFEMTLAGVTILQG